MMSPGIARMGVSSRLWLDLFDFLLESLSTVALRDRDRDLSLLSVGESPRDLDLDRSRDFLFSFFR